MNNLTSTRSSYRPPAYHFIASMNPPILSKATAWGLILFLTLCQYKLAYASDNAKNELVYGETTRLDTFDPYTTHESAGHRLSELLFDAMFIPLANGGYQNHLAASYEVQNNGTCVQVSLKDGVFWHSSSDQVLSHKLSAKDIETTIRLITNSISSIPNRDQWDSIAKVEILGALKLKVYFNRALVDPLKILTFKVLPHHILNSAKALTRDLDFVTHPIGTGPYRLSRIGEQGEVLLEANNDYFQGKPQIERMIMKTYADHNIMAQSLMYQSLDLVTYVSPRDLTEVMGDKHIGVIPYDALSFTFIAINNKKPNLKDKRVRQAINYAIDRQEMLNAFFQNKGTIISGPFPPTSWAYNLDVRPYSFDPNRSNQLMNAAGFTKTNGKWFNRAKEQVVLDFAVPIGGESETIKRIALATQGYLGEVGIEVKLTFMDWLVWKKKILGDHNFDLTMASWSFDDASNITSLFHSGYSKPWGNNFVEFQNFEVDTMLTEANVTNDFDKRQAIYQKLHHVIADEAPYAFLWTLMHHAAHRNRISGIYIEPNAFFKNVGKWSIKEDSSSEQSY